MPYSIIRNDITKMHVDAIVNPTDWMYSGSGGTDKKVHDAAGPALDLACKDLPLLAEGTVAVTPGFNLPCRYIIHTNGPVWEGGKQYEREALIACYRNALSAAAERYCETIALPLIASGTFGYPKDQVLRVALEAITEFLITHEMTVFIVVYDKESYAISKKLQANIDSYIDENYIGEDNPSSLSDRLNAWDGKTDFLSNVVFDTAIFPTAPAPKAEDAEKPTPAPLPDLFAPSVGKSSRKTASTPRPVSAPAAKVSLEDMLSKMDESFSGALLRLIAAKNMTNAQCYQKANIDKKLFSKILRPGYHPSKPTILALAIALELDLDETKALLEKAGLALSRSSKFDVIVQYFIVNGRYDLMEINEVLYKYDQNLLGNVIA